MKQKAIVLLSGGLDSATTLAIANHEGFDCYALSIDYGQRHHAELAAAKIVAQRARVVEHKIITIGLDQIGGSALTDTNIAVPAASTPIGDIPITYVPARNTVFLSLALGWAEVLNVDHIFMGVNAVDYSGYPDCRPVFIGAFETLANVATKRAVEGHKMKIHTPLITLSKADIIRTGVELGVDFSTTVSCYQADEQGRACGVCDSCRLRRLGFEASGISDATRYR